MLPLRSLSNMLIPQGFLSDLFGAMSTCFFAPLMGGEVDSYPNALTIPKASYIPTDYPLGRKSDLLGIGFGAM